MSKQLIVFFFLGLKEALIVFGPQKKRFPKRGENIGLRIGKERHHFR